MIQLKKLPFEFPLDNGKYFRRTSYLTVSLKAQKDTWGGGVVRGWPFSKMKSSLHSIWPTYTKSNWKSCKKKPTPIILSSKPNISSFSVISDRFSLCSPWKTHIFPKHPYFSKLIHKLIWISLQKIMIAPRKVYWRCCHPKFKFIILVPWLLPWIPQWLFPSNGFCHMIEPCIVPWVLPWNPLWVLLSNGFCHMNKPSLVAGKGWHFVRTFFVVCILSVPFFGLDFVRTISTCFGILSVGILSYHRWEKWNFLCSKQHGFQSFEKNYEDDSLNITQMWKWTSFSSMLTQLSQISQYIRSTAREWPSKCAEQTEKQVNG